MKIIHYCHINIYFYLGEWCSHDNQYTGVTVVYYFTVIDPIDVYYWKKELDLMFLITCHDSSDCNSNTAVTNLSSNILPNEEYILKFGLKFVLTTRSNVSNVLV